MSSLKLRLKPGLDPRPYAEAYARDGIVQIRDFMDVETAAAVAEMLETRMTWSIICPDFQGGSLVIDREVVQKFGQEQVTRHLKEVTKRASGGFAYIHLSYSMIDELQAARDPANPVHDLTRWLMGREFLDFGQAVIGAPSVSKVSAQASWYRPGDFLTIHSDSHPTDSRLAAFTLGMTRRWRPDWGGQLLFHDDNGDVSHGYTPGFNVLTLFKVPRSHSVATVAPYAAAPRLSVTGWLRDD